MDYRGKRGRYWITQMPDCPSWNIYNDCGICEEYGFESEEEALQYCIDNDY